MDDRPPVLDYYVPGEPGPPVERVLPKITRLPYWFFSVGVVFVTLAMAFTRQATCNWIPPLAVVAFFCGTLSGFILANAHSSAVPLLGALVNLLPLVLLCAGGLYL